MRTTLLPLLLLSLSASTASAIATLDLAIDLAQQSPGGVVMRPLVIGEERAVRLTLLHLLPSVRYDLLIRLDNREMPMIALGSPVRSSLSPGMEDKLFAAIVAGTDTLGRDQTTARFIEESSAHSQSESADDTADYYTSQRFDAVTLLRPGQQLSVMVRRHASPGAPAAEWTTHFTTEKRGEWRVSFGFGCPVLLNNNREFFTRRDSANLYTIMEKPGEERMQLIPALFFHWLPVSDELSNWSWSITAGLGLDFKDAVVFAGGSVTFNQNITLAFGGVAHKLDRLNSKYEIGERVREDLDAEQLYEGCYQINPFVGIAFRLGEKLFGD